MTLQKFSTLAVLASSAAANLLSINISEDGVNMQKWIKGMDFSVTEVLDGKLSTEPNNLMFLQDIDEVGADFAYRPQLRGGSIDYDVNLSYNDCGCVSSLYLVATDNEMCSQNTMDSNDVNCPSIDVMQANNYGFNVGANPCADGNCDPISQCMYDMREEGAAEYGSGAYGPGGSLINSYGEFHVKTQFLSTADYSEFWGLRTTISQGTNSIVMEKDCRGYLDGLNDLVDGGMQFVFSQWENVNNTIDFENDQCEAILPCSESWSTFRNIEIRTEGSNEDPFVPEPEFKDLMVFQAWPESATESSMFVKGLEGQQLSTEGSEMLMGPNNKAFVRETEDVEYVHDLLGGSITYRVDVNQFECGYAAGAFLVDLQDESCSWDHYTPGEVPQCSSIQLMEANLYSFNVETTPCEFGFCEEQLACSASFDGASYGPGKEINTQLPYDVFTQFMAKDDGFSLELAKIVTTLTQSGNSVTITQECPDALASISEKLVSNMSLAVSNYQLASSDLCSASSDYASVSVKDISFVAGDSIFVEEEEEEEEGELIDVGPAPYLDSGNCGTDCAECREYVDSVSGASSYECIDTTIYKFGSRCPSKDSKDSCMTDDGTCINSYPFGDPDKFNSPYAKCRSVPYAQRLEQDELKYARKECRRATDGLCVLGCGEGTCHKSWPIDDKLRGKSLYAMCRCKQ